MDVAALAAEGVTIGVSVGGWDDVTFGAGVFGISDSVAPMAQASESPLGSGLVSPSDRPAEWEDC